MSTLVEKLEARLLKFHDFAQTAVGWAAMTTEWQGEIEAVEQDLRALLADHAKEGELMGALPDPKSWMIENVGPVPPLEEEGKKDRWLTTLGILVHYKSDAAFRPAPAAPDGPREKVGETRREWIEHIDVIDAALAPRKEGEG